MEYQSQKFDKTDEYFLKGKVDWLRDDICVAFIACNLSRPELLSRNIMSKQYLGQIDRELTHPVAYKLEDRCVTNDHMAMAGDLTVKAKELNPTRMQLKVTGLVVFQKTSSVFTSRLLMVTNWHTITLDQITNQFVISWKNDVDGIFPLPLPV